MSERVKRAVTIQQPNATLVAMGQQLVDNRTWALHRSFWGWIGIHAGVSRVRDAEFPQYGLDPERVPYGAMVAVAHLAICIKVDGIDGLINQSPERFTWLADHAHVEGPVCWVFDKVIPLSTPLKMRGNRGLWDIDPELLWKVHSRAKQSTKAFTPPQANRA